MNRGGYQPTNNIDTNKPPGAESVPEIKPQSVTLSWDDYMTLKEKAEKSEKDPEMYYEVNLDLSKSLIIQATSIIEKEIKTMSVTPKEAVIVDKKGMILLKFTLSCLGECFMQR